MSRCIVGLTAVFICLTLAGCGRGTQSAAQFESEFVHREKSGSAYTRGMTYSNNRKPDRGWDGNKVVVGVKGGEAQFTFTFVGHREGKDVYRVARSFPLGDDRAKTVSVEIAYEGKEIVLFDDDVGKTFLRPSPLTRK